MVDAKDVGELLKDHFDQLADDQFLSNLQEACPELGQAQQLPLLGSGSGGTGESQLVLVEQIPTPLRLNAYLASALTGLNPDQRQLVFQLSDLVSTICSEHGIDVYEPRKKTDPVHHPDVDDTEVFRTDRARVLASDLLILLSHYPSFGAGEELDFAYNALVPVMIISQSESRVSRMVTGVPSFRLLINYSQPEELRHELRDRLTEVRPVLEERKLAFSQYDTNIVGERIRLLRQKLGLTREDFIQNGSLLTLETLRHIEESSDKISNPSLIQLRQIATLLKTTVADLVEPDLNERILAALLEWVSQNQAPRFGGVSVKDRNRILRRILLRLIDSLEED